ncbi:cyclin-O [Denticeps clupeoides]|nr:cyclin-O [Denticeps clupeoides]
MSVLSDSGFEEDLQTPSPVLRLEWPADAARLMGAWPAGSPDCEESCFRVQKRNQEEFRTGSCLERQPQLTAGARCTLVSWLIAVHRHFELSFESCCLAVNIMDRFLSTTAVAADCFQLLGITALLIASKQVEVCSPRIRQLLSLCCDAFSREQLCNLECLVLLRLNFRLAAPTPAFFLHYYTHRALPEDAAHAPCGLLARRICELSLADYAFNRYPPCTTARCALQLALELLGVATPPSLDEGGGEERLLSQDCSKALRLLLSLNHEALQVLLMT